MQVIDQEIKKTDLLGSKNVFEGPMIKAVVDVKKEIVAIDSELHADLEQLLLSRDSNQDDLWGINLYPEETEDFIEFDSMINIRPRQNNFSRDVENEETRKTIQKVVEKWIK